MPNYSNTGKLPKSNMSANPPKGKPGKKSIPEHEPGLDDNTRVIYAEESDPGDGGGRQ